MFLNIGVAFAFLLALNAFNSNSLNVPRKRSNVYAHGPTTDISGLYVSPGYSHDMYHARKAVSPVEQLSWAECRTVVASVRALADQPTGIGMNDLTVFLAKVALGLPFGMARFNDGEIIAAKKKAGLTDRNQRHLSPELQRLMLDAMNLDRSGFYAGLPCNKQFPDSRKWANAVVHGHKATKITSATVWYDGNYGLSRRFLVRLLKIRRDRVWIVASDAANVTRLEAAIGLQFTGVLRVPATESFPAGFRKHKDATFEKGDVVLVCAGPTGRLLTAHWFDINPNATYIEIGSYFDEHLGTVPSVAAPNYYIGIATPCESDSDLRAETDPVPLEEAAWCALKLKQGKFFVGGTFNKDRLSRAAVMENNEPDKITVVVSSYKSDLACLKQQIQNFQQCDIVHSIRLNRFDGDTTFDQAWVKSVSDPDVPVIVDDYGDKLTNRFHPRDFMTRAVFSVDVDTMYSCAALHAAFFEWVKHPFSAVGFHPRFLEKGKAENWDQSYSSPYKRNMLLVTKGALQHRRMFSRFFEPRYAALRQLVDKKMTGEDFLMGFVQALEGDPVVRMVCLGDKEACHTAMCHKGAKSLFSRTSSHRTEVLLSLFKVLGNPLRTTTGRKGGKGPVCLSKPRDPTNYGLCYASKAIAQLVPGVSALTVGDGIPTTIVQTMRPPVPDFVKAAWLSLNPGFDYQFFDDNAARSAVAHDCPELLKTYDAMPLPKYKSDAFRYCWLYHHGGIYADIDLVPMVGVRSFLPSNARLWSVVTDTFGGEHIFQAYLIAVRHHPAMRAAIDLMIKIGASFQNVGPPYHTHPTNQLFNVLRDATKPSNLRTLPSTSTVQLANERCLGSLQDCFVEFNGVKVAQSRDPRWKDGQWKT